MKIQVAGLSQGMHGYSFRAAPEDLGLDQRFRKEIRLDATLEKAPTQIVIEVKATYEGFFECDRCIRPFTLPVENSYRMYYVWDGAEAQRLDPSEVQVVSPSLSVIDITDDVRQTILLSVPFKLLCKTECKGLCPHCGKNLNEEVCSCTDETPDSRWEALRILRKN